MLIDHFEVREKEKNGVIVCCGLLQLRNLITYMRNSFQLPCLIQESHFLLVLSTFSQVSINDCCLGALFPCGAL